MLSSFVEPSCFLYNLRLQIPSRISAYCRRYSFIVIYSSALHIVLIHICNNFHSCSSQSVSSLKISHAILVVLRLYCTSCSIIAHIERFNNQTIFLYARNCIAYTISPGFKLLHIVSALFQISAFVLLSYFLPVFRTLRSKALNFFDIISLTWCLVIISCYSQTTVGCLITYTYCALYITFLSTIAEYIINKFL